jgi:hypothetical protein
MHPGVLACALGLPFALSGSYMSLGALVCALGLLLVPPFIHTRPLYLCAPLPFVRTSLSMRASPHSYSPPLPALARLSLCAQVFLAQTIPSSLALPSFHLFVPPSDLSVHLDCVRPLAFLHPSFPCVNYSKFLNSLLAHRFPAPSSPFATKFSLSKPFQVPQFFLHLPTCALLRVRALLRRTRFPSSVCLPPLCASIFPLPYVHPGPPPVCTPLSLCAQVWLSQIIPIYHHYIFPHLHQFLGSPTRMCPLCLMCSSYPCLNHFKLLTTPLPHIHARPLANMPLRPFLCTNVLPYVPYDSCMCPGAPICTLELMYAPWGSCLFLRAPVCALGLPYAP